MIKLTCTSKILLAFLACLPAYCFPQQVTFTDITEANQIDHVYGYDFNEPEIAYLLNMAQKILSNIKLAQEPLGQFLQIENLNGKTKNEWMVDNKEKLASTLEGDGPYTFKGVGRLPSDDCFLQIFALVEAGIHPEQLIKP